MGNLETAAMVAVLEVDDALELANLACARADVLQAKLDGALFKLGIALFALEVTQKELASGNGHQGMVMETVRRALADVQVTE